MTPLRLTALALLAGLLPRRLSAVRWGIAGQIVWAWVLTIPAAATIGAISYYIVRVFI